MKGRTQANPSPNHPIQRSAAAKSRAYPVSRKHQVIQRVFDPFFNRNIPERWATITPGLYALNEENGQKIKSGNYTFVGLHGTSIAHASAMLRGINPPGGGANSGEHLGPGFYVTKKEGEALDFAEVAVFGPEPEMQENQNFNNWQQQTDTFKAQKKKYGGKSTIILYIYAQNFQQMSGAEFAKERQLGQMQTMMEQNDYFMNPGGQSSLDEIKFNQRAYNKLVAVMTPPE